LVSACRTPSEVQQEVRPPSEMGHRRLEEVAEEEEKK
jgi:hypothetical protein